MKKLSENNDSWDEIRKKIIGFGENSIRKNYYPELQQRIIDLERFRTLLDQSNDFIFLINAPSGEIIDINDSACKKLGYSKAKFLSMSINDFFPIDVTDQIRHLFSEEKSENKNVRKITTKLKKSDGEDISVEISLKIATFDDMLTAVIIARDITERINSLYEKEKLQKKLFLSQKLESVGRLAGGVAHDFNNMLSIILIHSELALGKIDPTNEFYNDFMGIYNAAQRSADLTHQLLSFAKKQIVAPKIVELNIIIDNMLSMLRRIIGEDIHLAWVPKRNLWKLKVDPTQIDQILVNLCVNAREAIPSTGKVIIETNNISLDNFSCLYQENLTPGDYILITVSDDGCGMDKEELDHIFEPFFTTKNSGKNTGLGLATVYGIVKQNKGYIHVYSEPQIGTTFKIYLPRYAGKKDLDIPSPTQKDLVHDTKGRLETILIVEDEIDVLEQLKRMLQKMKYKVLTANTPLKAITLAMNFSENIDLLLTDVIMPEMNGKELSEKLSLIYPNLKCLFMSGYTSEIIAHRGIIDKDLCFIQKPFSIKDLAFNIRKALD